MLKDKFKGVTKVGDNDVEKVAKSKPDLIIVYSTDKTSKIQKIAPTVVFDYGKHKYLDQQEELGKLLGKEDKVKAWEEKWKAKTKKMVKKSKKNWFRCNSINLR